MTTTSIEEAQAITADVENELHDEDDQEEDLKLRRIVRCTNGQLHKQCVDWLTMQPKKPLGSILSRHPIHGQTEHWRPTCVVVGTDGNRAVLYCWGFQPWVWEFTGNKVWRKERTISTKPAPAQSKPASAPGTASAQFSSLLSFSCCHFFFSHDTIHYRTLAKPAKLKFCFNLDCHSCGIQEHRNADSQSQHDRFAELKSRRARLVVTNAVAPFWKRGLVWKKGYDWSNQQNLLRGRTFGAEG